MPVGPVFVCSVVKHYSVLNMVHGLEKFIKPTSREFRTRTSSAAACSRHANGHGWVLRLRAAQNYSHTEATSSSGVNWSDLTCADKDVEPDRVLGS